MAEGVPRVVYHGQATPGTPVPPCPPLHWRPPHELAGLESVLWAQNRECVTLKEDLKSIQERLSGFWLPSEPHVARIT